MTDLMPAAFIGHGSPMNTLEHNRWTESWVSLATSFEKPKAILAISAHWYVGITAVTAMASPRTIHDFYGFPQELFDVEYPAPGNPDLALQVAEAVKPSYCGPDTDSWGLDHGTWSILKHMYPDADVPVVQLSIHAAESPEYHVALGRSLNQLRSEGVFIVGSGNVVHNLGLIEWGRGEYGAPWAEKFDAAAAEIMTSDPARINDVLAMPEARPSVPTPDHYLPLCYLAGVADAAGTTAKTLVSGCELGSLSMTSYVVH